MKNLALHWKIIIGLVLGIIWALLSSAMGWSKFTIDWINPWGKIFISILKMIAVPLVLFSIIKGITGLSDVSKLGRMGAKTIALYLITTVLAVSLGLGLVNFLQPGNLLSEEQRIVNRIGYELWANEVGAEIKDDKSFLTNPKYTAYIEKATSQNSEYASNETFNNKKGTAQQTKNSGPLQFVIDMVPSNLFNSLGDNGAMLQIIFFGVLFAITMLMLDPVIVKPVNDVVDAMNEIFLKMVDIIMKGAPFFVFALLAGKLSEMAGDNPAAVIEIFKGLGGYSLVVVVGLAFMIFVFYPLIMKLISSGISYTDFFKGIGSAQMLAFSTSSSAATLPVTIDCVRDNLGVPEETTSFVLPIGATVNMDGTSLYQAVAVIFLAQVHMVDLSMGQQLTIVLTATLASIGSAAVPSAGLIMLMIVLESVGLNPAWIAIIFPVDRILDMCRTVVNVTGDSAVATVIASSEGQLKPSKD